MLNSYIYFLIFPKIYFKMYPQYFFQYFLQNLFLFHFLTFLLQILSYVFCFRKTFYTHILYLYIFVKYCYKFYLHLYVLYIIFYLNKLYNFQFSLSNCDLDLMRRLASLRTSKCILKVYEFGWYPSQVWRPAMQFTVKLT